MFGHKCTGLFAAGCFMLACLAPSAHADEIFGIYTNTSSISGVSGYIDLSFSYTTGMDTATAAITGFLTDGVLGGCALGCLTHDASGELPGTVIISNGAPDGPTDDDYDEPITFGNYLEFAVAISGPALTAAGQTGASTFSLSYYDGGYVPLLSDTFAGASATLTIDPSHTITPETYADAIGTMDTTIHPPAPLPEPSSFPLFGGGLTLLAGGAGLRRLRRRAA